MDPLHKTDSAISVTSKRDLRPSTSYDDYPPDDYPPPSSASSATDRHSFDHAAAAADARQASLTDRVPPVPLKAPKDAQRPPAASAGQSAQAPSSAALATDNAHPATSPPAIATATAKATPSVPVRVVPDSPTNPDAPPLDLYPASADDNKPLPSATDAAEFTLDALTQSGTGAIDVDHDQLELESDLGYGSESSSFASTSLSSSVRDYMFENGRRYHRFREGRYNFPNDEPEQDREDMKHTCIKLLCQGQLYFAPLEEGRVHNILDIGTGTGIWAIEMGDQFPSANVLGIDLSPIQPEWVPANVHFEVDDAESQWAHPPDYFDYVHMRHTVMAIKDWPNLYRTAKEHIRPGGWIESQEIYHYPISANDSMPLEHPVAQYWALIHQGLNRLNIDFQGAAGGKMATMMRDAGFENVHERVFHVPIGTWPKHPDLKVVGEYWRHVLLSGAQAIALGPLTRGCGWTREEVELFLVDLRRAYYDNNSLMYMPLYVTYGQKPEQ